MLGQVFLLLIVYQEKHFWADYPLQFPWMLGKFLPGWKFVKPLAAHCAVHAYFTFVISAFFLCWVHGPGYGPLPFYLAAFDFVVHFIMDRIKASPDLLGRFEALSKREYMAWKRMGEVSTETDPAKIPVPSLTPEAGAERDAQFRSNKFFWWSLGIDQKVHHLTHYAIIYWLVTA
jgi:hypothetical protein